MLINFRSAFEKVFKSFDVAWDTKSLEKLEQEWHRFVLLIKRHWIFSILSSWRVIFVIIIWFANIYLLTFWNQNKDLISVILWIFLLFNIVYWVSIVFWYIYRFYKIQWSNPHIEDIYSAIKQSKDNDKIFQSFFNQTVFLLILLFIITVISVITWIIWLLKWWSETFWVWIFNAFLLLFQLGLFYWYLMKMINQEMDFKIIIPGQIRFFNQRWVLWDSQNMNANKIKTFNTKYSWILWSFFNYWDIIILSEWDSRDTWKMRMDYIWNPTKTVKEIEKVLNKDFAVMEADVNVLLKKLEHIINIDNINTNENKEKLRKYIKDNDLYLNNLYNSSDDETKREIKELYILIAE